MNIVFPVWMDRLGGSLTDYNSSHNGVIRLCGYTVVKVKVIYEKPYNRITVQPYRCTNGHHTVFSSDVMILAALSGAEVSPSKACTSLYPSSICWRA